MGGCIPIGDNGTDHNITEQQWKFVLNVVGPLGARTARIGPTSGWVAVTVDGEREHIGGSGYFHEATVEVADGSLIDEHHRQFTLALNALIGKHGKGQTLPALEIDFRVGLFVGDKHGDLAVGGATTSSALRARWTGHVMFAAAS
jgi:hypothetical protein